MRFLKYLNEDKETFEADKILKSLKDKDSKLTAVQAHEIKNKLMKDPVFCDIKISLNIWEKGKEKKAEGVLVGNFRSIYKTGFDSRGKKKKIKHCTITLYDGKLYTLIHELAHAPSEDSHGESFRNMLKYIVNLYNKEC